MQLLSRFQKRTVPWCEICEWAVVVLLITSVLWRGGKSLDMTWIFTGVACVAAIVSHTANRRTGDREVPLVFWSAVIGFTVLSVISYITSSTANYGVDEVLRTGAISLMLLWIIRQARDKERGQEYIDRLVRFLCITVIAACVIGLMVYVFQPVNRFVGTFFDYRFHTDYWPNAWAEFLLMTWPIVLYWVLRDFEFDKSDVRSRLEFIVRASVLGLVFGSLLLSFSRGGVLVFFAQIALWAGIIFKKTRPNFPIRPVVPTVVLLIAMTVVTVLISNGLRGQLYEVQNVEEKVTLTAAEGTSSVSERVQFWSQSTNLALQKPLLGWGPYSFRFIQPELQTGILATSDHPHNVLLKIIMERGVLSLLVFVLVVGLGMYRAAVMLLSPRVEVGTLKFSLRMLIFLGLSGVLLHNMIDFNLQFVGIALPFWLLLGILFSYLDLDSMRNVPTKIARFSELGLATALLLFACYEGSYLVVTSIGRNAEAGGDPFTAMEWYDKASGEVFTRDLHLSRAKILFQESKFDEAQLALDTYFEQNEHDFRAWKRQGDIALMRGEKQLALEAYTRAFKRGKYNDISILHGMIEAYMALDRKEEIEKKRAMIDELLKQYADAIARNAHYIALSPNVEEFIAVCNTLARLFKDEAPRYQVMAAKADHHAQIERENLASRPPGFLW